MSAEPVARVKFRVSPRTRYIHMEGIQSTAESTIERQPEPKPILRLEEAVINRIAAGEASPFSHC